MGSDQDDGPEGSGGFEVEVKDAAVRGSACLFASSVFLRCTGDRRLDSSQIPNQIITCLANKLTYGPDV